MPVFSPWPLRPVPPTTITGRRGPLKPLPTPSKSVPAHHRTPRGHTVGGGEEARPTQRRRALPLPLPAHSPHLPSARRRPAPIHPFPHPRAPVRWAPVRECGAVPRHDGSPPRPLRGVTPSTNRLCGTTGPHSLRLQFPALLTC